MGGIWTSYLCWGSREASFPPPKPLLRLWRGNVGSCSRSPSSARLILFFEGGGFPYSNRPQKKGTLILTLFTGGPSVGSCLFV